MSIPILDVSAWREFRGTPGDSGRNLNQTTHLAKIEDGSGKLRDCYVKLLPLQYPALLGEAIGWLLGRSSGVTCVNFAAILLVPLEHLRKNIELPSEFDGIDVCPAWCSEVAGEPVRQINSWSFWWSRRNCLRSKDARAIAAFDQWTDLRDRHFGNVIRGAGGNYVSIDHETILHDLLWLPTGRTYAPRSLLEVAQRHMSEKEFLRFQVEMVSASKKHAHGLAAASADIADVTQKIYPKAGRLVQEILDMLNERSQSAWLGDKMGVIA